MALFLGKHLKSIARIVKYYEIVAKEGYLKFDRQL